MAQRRPVTPRDLFRFHPITDVQISPDGSLIAYVIQDVDPEKNNCRSSIWLAPVGSGAPRRLTNPGDGSDRSPRWSPAGDRIAFVSERQGKPQLWVIPVGGGEAYCLETEQRPASEPVWSPDGRQIAFAAYVFDRSPDWAPYPGAPEGDGQRAREAALHDPHGEKKGGREPSGVKVITRLKYRTDGLGYHGDKRSHIFVREADGSGPARQVTSGDFDHGMPAWTPDGRSILCSALRRHDADRFFHTEIWRFDLASGEAALVGENGAPAAGLRVSPDGRHLAFVGHHGEHRTSTSAQLMLVPLEPGVGKQSCTSLSACLDRPVGPWSMTDLRGMPVLATQWAADSKGAYALVSDHGDCHVYYFPADGGAPRQVTMGEGRTVAAFSVAADGTLALIAGDGGAPDEVYVLSRGEERRLTNHNRAADELDLVRPEPFTYAGADGWPINGWIIKPVGYDPGKRYPTVLSIHGGPHAAYGNSPTILFQALASSGFAVLYTNPRGSQGYGQSFARAVVTDWGGKDYADLMAGVDAAVALGVADPDRLGVMGWSYGGYLTCWTVTQSDRFKAAIAGAPVSNAHSMIGTTDMPWFAEWQLGGNPWTREGEELLLSRSPIRYADRVTTPTMIMCGEGDLRCPIAQAEEFYMALKRLDRAPAVQIRYPGEFHGLAKPRHTLDRYERTIAWFRHYL